jgi:DNA-3-methyladenine glycosylase II
VTKALEFLKAKDERLASIIDKTALETNKWSGAIFEDLVSCILDMQIRYRGYATRYKRLKECLGNRRLLTDAIYYFSAECIKKINMSRQKQAALNVLADYWTENNHNETDWHNISDEEIRTFLLKIKGIGNWTVDMILLFTLQRVDIFPIDDLQLKKTMRKVYEIGESENLKKEMELISDEWKPYRSTAVLYLLENAKKSIK